MAENAHKLLLLDVGLLCGTLQKKKKWLDKKYFLRCFNFCKDVNIMSDI